MLKIKLINREIKKNDKRNIILFLTKYLFSLRFKKKLIENKMKNKFIIKLPKIKLNGKSVKINIKSLSLFLIFNFFFLILSIIKLVAGDGFEPPTFRL